MKTMWLIFAAVLVLALVSSMAPRPSAGPLTIANDRGGSVVEYVRRFDDLAARRRHVRIDGACLSACTFVLRMPRSLVCATPRAYFGFHNAYRRSDNVQAPPAITAQVLALYPPDVQAWLTWHGGLRPELVYTSATTFLTLCPSAPLAPSPPPR